MIKIGIWYLVDENIRFVKKYDILDLFNYFFNEEWDIVFLYVIEILVEDELNYIDF